jgi:uncharacterized membrane protein (UPF0136 family)
VGFLGHYFAARAIGGSYIAFRDHLGGFVMLTVVSALVVWGLSLRFFKGRSDMVILLVGIVQALLGVYIYMNRFSVHG